MVENVSTSESCALRVIKPIPPASSSTTSRFDSTRLPSMSMPRPIPTPATPGWPVQEGVPGCIRPPLPCLVFTVTNITTLLRSTPAATRHPAPPLPLPIPSPMPNPEPRTELETVSVSVSRWLPTADRVYRVHHTPWRSVFSDNLSELIRPPHLYSAVRRL